MAKLVKTEEIEWDTCKQCPFCKSGYTGTDGFGIGPTYNANYCEYGYFGKTVGNDFNGEIIWDSSIKVPDCIPPQCEYSDKHWNLDDDYSFIEVVKTYNNEELIELANYLRSPEYIEDKQNYIKAKEQEIKDIQENKEYKDYLKGIVTHLENNGYTVLDSVKENIKEV